MSTCQRNIPNSYEDQRTFEIMADGEETETNIASNGCYSGEYLPTDCKFTLHTFSDRFADQTVHFQVVKMTNSLYLWIGTSSEMNALAVAMCTKWDPVPAAVDLIGNKADLSSSTLAQRIAKKTNKQCFVSYNAPTENGLVGLVEERICQEMKDKPQKF